MIGAIIAILFACAMLFILCNMCSSYEKQVDALKQEVERLSKTESVYMARLQEVEDEKAEIVLQMLTTALKKKEVELEPTFRLYRSFIAEIYRKDPSVVLGLIQQTEQRVLHKRMSYHSFEQPNYSTGDYDAPVEISVLRKELDLLQIHISESNDQPVLYVSYQSEKFAMSLSPALAYLGNEALLKDLLASHIKYAIEALEPYKKR